MVFSNIYVEALCMEVAPVCICHTFIYICTAVAATGVFQLISLLALAVEAPKCVDTSAVVRADSFASGAFINVYSRRRDAGQIQVK